MRLHPTTRWLVLLWGLLAACVHSAPGLREDTESFESVSSWEQAREDPTCVVPLCDEERCALWRCGELVEVEASPQVVLTRGPVGMRPPLVGNPSRWWGVSLVAPTTAEPVFEIPWHHWNTRGRFARGRHPLACMLPPEPLEKHHIFPQERELAGWFALKQIAIHDYTVSLPRSVHRRLHSGEPKGGHWNAAWRQFRLDNPGAQPAEIWRFAFELMWRFNINGPLGPYYCQD